MNFVSSTKSNYLIFLRAGNTVYCNNYTKFINRFCVYTAYFLNVKVSSTRHSYYALNELHTLNEKNLPFAKYVNYQNNVRVNQLGSNYPTI